MVSGSGNFTVGARVKRNHAVFSTRAVDPDCVWIRVTGVYILLEDSGCTGVYILP